MGVRKLRGSHAALAVAVAAMVVLPIAMAGADGPEASTSASAKKAVKKLKRRVAALEARQTLPPSGPAGGDLAGSYPGPEIGANRVGAPELAADSVGTSELATDSVGSEELALDGVGSSELKGVTAVVGPGVEIEPGESAEATVTCPAGQMVVGGGFEWELAPNGAFIKHSSPAFAGDPNTTWVVRGTIIGGLTNTLHARASCLAV